MQAGWPVAILAAVGQQVRRFLLITETALVFEAGGVADNALRVVLPADHLAGSLIGCFRLTVFDQGGVGLTVLGLIPDPASVTMTLGTALRTCKDRTGLV